MDTQEINERLITTRTSIAEEKMIEGSPWQHPLVIKLSDYTEGVCGFCDSPKTNNCYVCEKPHCDNHAHGALKDYPPSILLSICDDCFEDGNKVEFTEDQKRLMRRGY